MKECPLKLFFGDCANIEEDQCLVLINDAMGDGRLVNLQNELRKLPDDALMGNLSDYSQGTWLGDGCKAAGVIASAIRQEMERRRGK